MNKKVLGIAVVLMAVAMLALPMISTVQAWGWRRPAEVYDVSVSGFIVANSEVDFCVWRNWQCGRYTAHAINYATGEEMLRISYDDEELIGTVTYDISYVINLNTMEGVVRLKTRVILDNGEFVGNMFWIGDLVVKPDNTVRTTLGFPPYNEEGTWTWYTYWRGTDAYAGWTITQKMGPAMAETESYLTIR